MLDAVVAATAIGIATVAAIAEATPPVLATVLPARWSNLHTLLVSASALVTEVTCTTWTWLIAAGLTRFSAIEALPFLAAGLAIAIAWWRWIRGDSLTPFVIGILLPIASGVAFVGLAFSALGSIGAIGPAVPLPYFLESITVIALAGIVFGVAAMWPPRQRDPRIHGRMLQTSWPLAPYADMTPP